MKRFILPFLVITAMLPSYAIEPDVTQHADTKQLETQMKSFKNRLKTYMRCLRRKCSDEERKLAAQYIASDGIKLYFLLVAASILLPIPIAVLGSPNLRREVFSYIGQEIKESYITRPVLPARDVILGVKPGEERIIELDGQLWAITKKYFRTGYHNDFLSEEVIFSIGLPQEKWLQVNRRGPIKSLCSMFPQFGLLILALQRITNSERAKIAAIGLIIREQNGKGSELRDGLLAEISEGEHAQEGRPRWEGELGCETRLVYKPR